MTAASVHFFTKRLVHPIAISTLIFAVALGVRLLYVTTTVIEAPIRSDAAKYATIAVNLVQHRTYSHKNSANPTADASITPGYPLFLTAALLAKGDISSTYYFTLRIQAVLMALTASIVFLLGRQFLPYWGAILSGLMTALAPHMITISGFLVTEALFTFLVCLSILLVVMGISKQSRLALFLGAVLVGIGALVRPAFLLIPLVIAIVLLLNGRTLLVRSAKSAALVLLGVYLVWAPWSFWKADKEVSGNAAVASFALGSYPNLIFKDPKHAGFPYREDERYQQMSQDLGAAVDIISERASANPGRYAYWYLIGKPLTYWSWGMMAGGKGPFIYPVTKSIYTEYNFFGFTLWFFRAIHPLFALLSLATSVFLLRNLARSGYSIGSNAGILLIAGVLLYFTAIHMVFAPLPRYSIPVHPLLYLCGLYAITRILEFFRGPSVTNAK